MMAAAPLMAWSEVAGSGWDRVYAETAEAAARAMVAEDVRPAAAEHNSHGAQVAWTVGVYPSDPHRGRRNRLVGNTGRELRAILW